MNHRRIAVGLLACFLGIIVPVYHHVALHAAIAHQPSSSDVWRMSTVWNNLPWVDWAYLTFMWIVAAILITPELLSRARKRSLTRERPTARGFEVITDNSGEGATR